LGSLSLLGRLGPSGLFDCFGFFGLTAYYSLFANDYWPMTIDKLLFAICIHL